MNHVFRSVSRACACAIGSLNSSVLSTAAYLYRTEMGTKTRKLRNINPISKKKKFSSDPLLRSFGYQRSAVALLTILTSAVAKKDPNPVMARHRPMTTQRTLLGDWEYANSRPALVR